MIKALAEYERLAEAVVATEGSVRTSLFGVHPWAEVAIARVGAEPVGFAVWFFSYSTFLARPGLHLEDLFVYPEWRGHGIGRALLAYLAKVAVARDCGRTGVVGARLERVVDRFTEASAPRRWMSGRCSA